MIPFTFDNSYLSLDESLYSVIDTAPKMNTELLLLNEDVATSLHLNMEALKSPKGLSVLSGKSEEHKKFSQAYSGHQYGYFTTLGDGRALILGEHTVGDERYDIQLKGSGVTPYSRRGDGKATLKSMLREYLISEAMFHLGIPTTRSLAILKTNEKVIRSTVEDGAILVRTAKSHIRIGTFEYVRSLNDRTILKDFTDYTINRHYPHLNNKKDKYTIFFKEIMEKQADLIAKWQSVGFIHGVMNTDNTLISGETIDYGPCAFMDIFKEDAVFSSIDTQGRYSYKNQPYIISWNLMKLVEALLPLFDKDATTAINKANEVLSSFEAVYQKRYLHHMSKKLGILRPQKEDILLINELLLLLEKYELDFTNTFHMLSTDYQNLFAYNRFDPFLKKWEERIKDYEKEDVLSTMRKSNPIIIPRNILVEEALDSANSGDFTLFNEFLLHLKDPFNYSKNLPKKFRIPNTTTSFVTYCGT